MKSTELRELLHEKLRGVGVLQGLDDTLSQVLDFPEGFFVEVVLRDGGGLEAARRAVETVAEIVSDQGQHLDFVVRALWTIRAVQLEGAAYGTSGVPRNAVRFRVELASGSREESVFVDVSFAAIDRLRQKLGVPTPWTGWSGNEGDVPRDVLVNIVQEFVELQLSAGGTSYWDPILFPKQDLKAAAMSYLLERETILRST